MKVTINSVEIKALSHCVNPKETREFLQGVTVIVDGQQVSLFASTGTVIGFFRCPHHPDNAGNAGKCRVLIPYAIAKGLKSPCITLEVLEDIATLQDGNITAEVINIDKKLSHFPDFRRVWPRPEAVSGELAQYNPELIGLFAKCLKEFHGRKSVVQPYIHFNGDGPAPVDIAVDGFSGLIMPYRVQAKTYTYPFN